MPQERICSLQFGCPPHNSLDFSGHVNWTSELGISNAVHTQFPTSCGLQNQSPSRPLKQALQKSTRAYCEASAHLSNQQHVNHLHPHFLTPPSLAPCLAPSPSFHSALCLELGVEHKDLLGTLRLQRQLLRQLSLHRLRQRRSGSWPQNLWLAGEQFLPI